MVKVVLSGGGDENDSYLHHALFAAWLPHELPLLYLPGDAFPAADSYRWLCEVMVPFGVVSIAMWAGPADYDPAGLQRYGGVYIGGGNTFRLLANLRTKGMEPALRTFIAAGRPVFGGSAGAILLGRDIRSCAHMDPNDVGLSDTRGLGVVENFTIWCHYEPSNDDMIARFVADHPYSVLALSERSAVAVIGGELLAIGYDGVFRFSMQGKTYVAPGGSCREAPSGR